MSNDSVVDEFFSILNNNATPGFHTSAELLTKVFSPNGGVAPNQVPVVGITEHGRATGPRFIGTAGVTDLFDQLFLSFPDIVLTPLANAPRLYSLAGDVIAVQADFIGSYQKKWFQKPDPNHSLPLSALNPVLDPTTGLYKSVHIPAMLVFTFVTNKVTQLAVYMDRFKFTAAINAVRPATFARDISWFLHQISEAKR